MSERGQELADAAQALLGTSFKLHGRDPKRGIDCVGLVLCSLRIIGRHPVAPPAYALRNTGIEHLLPTISANGFAQSMDSQLPGDLIIVRPAVSQFHIAIAASDQHIIHAHAGLRRVVRSPQPADLSIVCRWRLT